MGSDWLEDSVKRNWLEDVATLSWLEGSITSKWLDDTKTPKRLDGVVVLDSVVELEWLEPVHELVSPVDKKDKDYNR